MDVLSLLKNSHKDSVTETVEILHETKLKSSMPKIFLKEDVLNIITIEDIANENKNKIKRTICVDMKANKSRKDLLSNIAKIAKSCGEPVINGELDNFDLLSQEENLEVLAKLITLSEMNKLSKLERLPVDF